jgi:HAD superfamily hydrolase (TIGR01509 family)
MKTNTLLFDLDGVLVDTHLIHFKSFKQALKQVLGTDVELLYQEYVYKYDNIPTYTKINNFLQDKNITSSKELINSIYNHKQHNTLQFYSTIKESRNIHNILTHFSKDFNLGCCTNSNRDVSLFLLSQLGILEYFDLVLTGSDIVSKKPKPDIYKKAIQYFNTSPKTTYIVEDSVQGIQAGVDSGSKVIYLDRQEKLTIDFIIKGITEFKKKDNMNIFYSNDLNLVIPMAGKGSRFINAGYENPKPLININNVPMISEVYNSLNLNSKCTFIVQKEHVETHNIDKILRDLQPGCNIVEVEGITEGAVCTILLSQHIIDNDKPLIISNCDNIVKWDPVDFMYKMDKLNADGGIVCFQDKSRDSKWSYVDIDSRYGNITKVVEKQAISEYATSGIYYWKKGSDFVEYAKKMINCNFRVNGEFYTAPVYDFAIKDSKKIYPYFISIEDMWGVGTPEDLEIYLKHNN